MGVGRTLLRFALLLGWLEVVVDPEILILKSEAMATLRSREMGLIVDSRGQPQGKGSKIDEQCAL